MSDRIEKVRAFMPKDQFELHINMTPGELRLITCRLMADYAESAVRDFARNVHSNLTLDDHRTRNLICDQFREMFGKELDVAKEEGANA